MQSAKIQRVAAKVLPKPAKRPNLALIEDRPAKNAKPSSASVLDPRRRKSPKLMQVRRDIEVFDGAGHLLRSYSVMLGANCIAAEYEEYALIMAEHDGLIAAEEVELCWARCDH
jgi:hypothetical protein